MIRVVLVDDVAEYRRLVALRLRLHGGFSVVGEASDGTTAVEVVGRTQPDVVVMDLGLPDLPGHDVVPRLRLASPQSGVVVFTGTYVEDSLGVRPFVEGYVAKSADLELLVKLLAEVGSEASLRAPTTVELPCDRRSPSEARRFVREQCTWARAEIVDAAELVVTELVTNAVVHAQTSCELRLFRADERLRIEVDDGGTGSPDVRLAADGDENGRGLVLVSAMSSAWGVVALPSGAKRVWAELVSEGVPSDRVR